MNEDIFVQAPLPMLTRFQVGDKVRLLTFPVGVEPASYQLEVSISRIMDGEFEGEIVRVSPLGRTSSTHRHFEIGGFVEFRGANIQGMAS
jgi:hypothetical protein